MQNIKNKVGGNIKRTRGGEDRVSRRRERANSMLVVEQWTEKERKEEKEGEKSARQKEEEFKRSKLVERLPSKRLERENEAGDGTKELIMVLKELN